jgi:hypothetical protein
MRPFAITVPTIWTGDSGREWRERGKDFQLLGHYLVSSPYSNMYGLYYQPFTAMLEEVGVDRPMALQVLQHFADSGYAKYDMRTNWVWVINGWRYQLMSFGRVPPASDKRIIGMHKWYAQCQPNPFLGLFFDHYGEEFRIPARRDEKSRMGAQRPLKPDPQRANFERWSAEYPNKDGFGAAWSVWLELAREFTIDDAYVNDVMLPALRAQKLRPRWQENDWQFVPAAARYLTERRWLDPVQPADSPADRNEVDEWLEQRRGVTDEERPPDES